MGRTRGRMRLCIALVIANVLFIWANSLLPGETSAAISGWVRDLLGDIFDGGQSGSESSHTLLRKMGHLSEFALLGLWLGWLFSMLGKRAWAGLIVGFPVACVDETIQRFVPDRGPSFRDVLIDTTGVCLGIGCLLMGYAIYKKRTRTTIGGNET